MAERPFLFFQPPVTANRSKLGGFGARYTKPTAAQQAARLEVRFTAIADGFQALQANVAGVVPEQVVVLETLTAAVNGVAKAASLIPGLEWLAELDLEDQAPEFGFADAEEAGAAVSRRLYALMSNQQAMNSLVDLWYQWVADPAQRAKRGFGPFKHLFELLKDIRRWSAEDRIRETGILDRWREHVEIGAVMRFEVEFWFRSVAAQRDAAVADMLIGLEEVGGTVLDQAVIDGIQYHAALVEVPGAAVQQFVNDADQGQYSRVLRSEGVMFFRPRAQAAFGISEVQPVAFDLAGRLAGHQGAAGSPTVAVFDGAPLAGHTALVGRIVVDDPDGFGGSYQARQMQHGTAMASTVIHGDLHDTGRALGAPVYVRPILQPDTIVGQTEITPPTRLLVDLVHRAFRRLFEQDGAQPAVAPSVRIVNLSIGDPTQPFDRTLSPLARLLDWLAWEFRLLIVVSIGNHPAVPIAFDPAWAVWSDAERTQQLLRSMHSSQIHRRPLSPSEAINCLSVGAAHVDHAAGFELGDRIDLARDARGPSPLSTVAQGFRRSTKPEVLFSGGRLLHRPNPVADGMVTFAAVDTTLAPGVLAATPGVAPMELGRVKYSCGTSNAAALATRCAALALEALGNTAIPADVGGLDGNHVAVVLKALVVHGASWGEAEALIEAAFPEAAADWHRMSRLKQQFLGYGLVDVSRATASSERRATVLGWGNIAREQAQTYRLPLPPSLAASTELRRLTTTLAWLTPANYRHQNYRRAQLWLNTVGPSLAPAVQGLDAQAARRGTVEHRIWQGEHAVPFVDGATIEISVNCKDDAGKLDVPVPYAIAVSLEVGVNSNVEVYEEVRARIRPAVAVAATP
jgi:hypothetical protein